MNVAVIGAGRWGRNLVNNLHALGALAAVADPEPQRAQDVTARFPEVPTYRDHRHILESDASAVAIATPSPSHFDIASACLEAGKDVFVEKPMAMESADAERLVALAKAHDRVLMVGHLLLYQPAIRWLREYIASGALGAVRRLHQERLGFGRARADENVLWSLGVHDVAVALYLLGAAPDEVDAYGQQGRMGTEEDIHVDLGFASGAQAHIHASWLWYERRRQLTVVAEGGVLVYDELAQNVTLHRRTIDEALVHEDGGSEVVFRGDAQPVRLEMQHFLARIADRSPPLSDGENGVRVVRVLEAADRALASRGRANLSH